MRSVSTRDELPVRSVSPCAGSFLSIDCTQPEMTSTEEELHSCVSVSVGSMSPAALGDQVPRGGKPAAEIDPKSHKVTIADTKRACTEKKVTQLDNRNSSADKKSTPMDNKSLSADPKRAPTDKESVCTTEKSSPNVDPKSVMIDPKCTKLDGKSVSGSRVVLPDRYQQMLTARRRHQSPVILSNPGTPTADLTTREKDLGTALAWIRQEMQQMKEQDKWLLKQFIDLRTNIVQLRCLYHYHYQGSAPDLASSLQGSSVSLNEAHKFPLGGLAHITRAESDLAMTSAGVKATSLPNSPQLFRFRWRSDELI